MSVRKIGGTGKFQVRWRDISNKAHALNFDKRGDADTFNRDKLSEVSKQRKARRRGAVELPDSDLEAYVADWLQAIKTRVRPQSLISYRGALASFVEALKGVERTKFLGGLKYVRIGITRQDASRAAGAMDLSKETKRHHLGIAAMMFGQAVKDGLISTNPIDGIADEVCGRKEPKRPKSLDRESFARLLRLLKGERYETAILAMGLSGLRIGEALALKWTDIDYARGTIRVERTALPGEIGTGPTKGGKVRTVDASAVLLDALKAHVGGKEFVQAEMDRPTKSTVWAMISRIRRMLARHAATLGVKITSHVMRHTWARLQVEQGAPITWLRDQAGHSNVSITVDLYGAGAVTSNRALADQLAESLK